MIRDDKAEIDLFADDHAREHIELEEQRTQIQSLQQRCRSGQSNFS
jgi:hypothetical protein